MGWNNLPSILCTSTDTVDNLVNLNLHYHRRVLPHPMDDRAEELETQTSTPIDPALVSIPRYPMLRRQNADLME